MSTITKFKLELVGTKCNEYPQLTILHNRQVIYSGLIIEHTILEFDITIDNHTVIMLQGIEKAQGENGKWDTQLDNDGHIVADKSLSINNIWFNNIGMGQEWIRSLTFINNINQEKFSGAGWWNNGSISFSPQLPLLDWIIQEKFIKFEHNQRELYSGIAKFDYEYVQQKINLINQMLND